VTHAGQSDPKVKELAHSKEEPATTKKGNNVEDSIYASTIGDCENGVKKNDEDASQSMVGSMMKMLRRLTGGKKSNDKKRPRSPSTTSCSSSSKKHKKTKKDKKKRRSSEEKSSRESPKKSIKQFASTVKLLTEIYLSDQDEVFEALNLKDDESSDTVIDKIGKHVMVNNSNSLLKANGLKTDNLDKGKTPRSILLMNVEENDMKEEKDKKDKTTRVTAIEWLLALLHRRLGPLSPVCV
jgi:hypothetical protein